MAEIKIIDKVILTKEGLMVKGTKQVAHLRQGELDGACAVYSMMMCLVIEKIIKVSDENDLAPQELTFSPIRGPEGNIEYLLLLEKGGVSKAEELCGRIKETVSLAFSSI